MHTALSARQGRLLRQACWCFPFLVALPVIAQLSSPPPSSPALAAPAAPFAEAATDALGYSAQARSFAVCRQAGVRVIDFPEEHSFAALWVPPKYASGRVMVLLHGTGGTAYDEIKDELESARKHGYMLIALQWLNKETQRYMDAPVVWRLADRALHFAGTQHHADPAKAALCGFSRGGAVSYETAWRDAQEHRHFKLVICHSGGVPPNAVTAPGEGWRPNTFFSRLNAGTLGAESYHGLNFFLYSGDRDEQWGTQMSEQMANAQKVLPLAGAKVAAWVRDPRGVHMGYRKTASIHEQAIQLFLRLTAEGK